MKPLGGRARPTLLTMESRVDEGSRTRLEFLTIQDDPKLDDRLFSPAPSSAGSSLVIPRDFGGTGPEESAVSAPADGGSLVAGETSSSE